MIDYFQKKWYGEMIWKINKRVSSIRKYEWNSETYVIYTYNRVSKRLNIYFVIILL